MNCVMIEYYPELTNIENSVLFDLENYLKAE